MRVAVLGYRSESAEGIAYLIGLLATVMPEADFIRFVNYESTKECVEIYKPHICIFYDESEHVEAIELAMENVGGYCIRLYEFLVENKFNDFKLNNYLSMFSLNVGNDKIDVNKLIEFEKFHSRIQVNLKDKDIHKYS